MALLYFAVLLQRGGPGLVRKVQGDTGSKPERCPFAVGVSLKASSPRSRAGVLSGLQLRKKACSQERGDVDFCVLEPPTPDL